MSSFWQADVTARDYRGELQRRIRNEQQCKQCQTCYGKKGESGHLRTPAIRHS